MLALALPVSGAVARLRDPSGLDELFVLEDAGPAAATVVGLARRLCPLPDGAGGWEQLPAVEIGAVALLIRRAWLGDLIRTESVCGAPDCGERIDIAFSISAYLEHHRPRRHRGVVQLDDELASDAGGWLALSGTQVRFRPPSIGDLAAAIEAADPEAVLRSRCVRPSDVSPAVARRIDRALASVAPSLSGEVEGTCPECGQTVRMLFEPVVYALAELRDAAAGVYADVATLASVCGWSERDILALPRRRRLRYVQAAVNDHADRADDADWYELVTK